MRPLQQALGFHPLWSAGLGLFFAAVLGPAPVVGGADGNPANQPSAETAVTVAAVEIRSSTGLDPKDDSISGSDLLALVPIQPGDVLRAADVRRGLRNLQAAGLAGKIEARVLREPGGARLIFALEPWVRVSAVEIQGDLGLRRADLEAVLEQTEASALAESRLIRGVYRLQDLYHEQGYREAEVRLDVETDDAARAARVTYRVNAGRRTTVGKVRFEGDLGGFSGEDLLDRARLRPGRGFRAADVDRDRERLEAELIRNGRRTARVAGPDVTFDAAAASVELVYAVDAGPRFELEVSGVDIELLRRRKLLRDFESQAYDDALLLKTVRSVRRDFQDRGHYRAEVDSRTRLDEERGVFEIEWAIRPGPVYELGAVELTGNRWTDDETLRTLMITAAKRPLVDDVLAEDLDNLRSYYALQGFRMAEIGPAVIEEPEDEPGTLALTIPIVEGPQQRVSSLAFRGHEPAGLDLADRALALQSSGPFHPRLLEDSTEELRAVLEAAGFLSAQVEAQLAWDPSETLVDVAFDVLPGPQAVLDRVVIRGNRRTHPRLLHRTIDLTPGEPLSRQKMLEIQRRLYKLGIFSRVDVRLAPAPPFASLRDVWVRVDEGSVRRLTYGVGYDTEDGVRGLFGYSHANLFGRGVSARFDSRWSQRERQARLLLRQPFLGRWRLPTTYSLFAVEEEQDSFDSRRRGAQIDANRFGRRFRYGLLYTYKVVEVLDADDALQPLEIDRDLSSVEISSLTPSISIDRRDDPLIPTRGWTASLQAEYAFPLFSAETEFLKVFAQHTGYLGLGRAGVLAGGLRAGAIEAVGDSNAQDPTLPPGLASRGVPISQRFFAGGRTTHRAYRRDRLGIPGLSLIQGSADSDDRLVPVGGNGLFLLNLDYRFPISGPLGGTVFVDAGNVWPDWSGVDLSGLKKGAGVGVRYLSPIGPVRLEVGWKLDREPGEDPAVIFLSFGNPF